MLEGLRATLGFPAVQVRDAGGDWQRGQEVVNELAREHWDLLVVLGTPALELVARRIKDRPVVFAMVANPYFTGAAYDPHRPEIHQRNITGVASPPPLAEALARGKKFFPGLTRWGLLFDPLSGSSLELRHLFEEAAREADLTPLTQPLAAGDEGQQALEALWQRGARVIYLPPDPGGGRPAETVLAYGRTGRVLVVNGNPWATSPGAVLTVTLDYAALGRRAAALAQRVLSGEHPHAIPIQQETPIHLAVDEKLLEAWSGYPPGPGAPPRSGGRPPT